LIIILTEDVNRVDSREEKSEAKLSKYLVSLRWYR